MIKTHPAGQHALPKNVINQVISGWTVLQYQLEAFVSFVRGNKQDVSCRISKMDVLEHGALCLVSQSLDM